MKALHWVVGFIFALPILAQAQAPAQPAAADKPAQVAAAPAAATATGTFEVVDAKLCSAIQDRQPADEKDTFATGDKAWLWMNLNPTGEATVRVRWTAPADAWTMDPAQVRFGRTWYYKTLHQPGEWTVEILDPADKVMWTKKFNVTGEALGAATPAPSAPTAAAAKEPTPTQTPTPTPAPAPVKAPTANAAPAAAPIKASAPVAMPADSNAKPETATGAGTHFDVVELQLAQGVKMDDRNPLNPGTTFASGSKVYAWLKLNVKDEESQVKIKWYKGEELAWTSGPVSVKQSPEWRTWMYKTVDGAGTWKVEVVDADDKPVQSTTFTVQ